MSYLFAKFPLPAQHLVRLGCILLIVETLIVQSIEAQADSISVSYLDEVVVSDTKFNSKRLNSGKTVIRIDAEEIARNPGRTITDLINSKSGIEIAGSRGRQGEVLGIFARGGRGRQVVVLIDGVRVSDPSSFAQEYDLRLLNPDEIESIEIIKGAASTLHGANAATAVISITTSNASKEPISGQFSSYLGTDQTASTQNYSVGHFRNAALVSGTLDKFSYTSSFQHQYANGMSSIRTMTDEKDPYSRYNINLGVGYRWDENSHIRIYANQTRFSSAYDESFGLMDADYLFQSDQKRIGLAYQLESEKMELRFNAAYTDYRSENISSFPGLFAGDNWVADLYGRIRILKGLQALGGINSILEKAVFGEEETYRLIDPYLNLVYSNDSGFTLSAGLRSNIHSEYGTNWVYSFNPSYVLKGETGSLKLFGSVATAYITPSLTQLFGEFGANPELEPESNRSLEGGMEFFADKGFRISAVFFNRKEENFVFFDNLLFAYGNAEQEVTANGLETELSWKPMSAIRIDANYTYTDRSGDNAIRIPKHKGWLQFGYEISPCTLINLEYAYTGSRPDTDFNTFEDRDLEAFSLIHIGIRHWVMPERLSFSLRAENLLNTEYTEIIGFNTRGRNLLVGLQLGL